MTIWFKMLSDEMSDLIIIMLEYVSYSSTALCRTIVNSQMQHYHRSVSLQKWLKSLYRNCCKSV